MNNKTRLVHCLLPLLLVFVTDSQAGGRPVKPTALINKFGFDSWNLERTACRPLSRTTVSRFKRCIAQGSRRTVAGNHVQYRCQTHDRTEVLIYQSRKVCRRQHQAMYVEGS